MKTCVLIDGHYEAYRAYFAMAQAGLTARHTGEPTGAVFGFLRQLFSLVRDYKPDYMVVAFDPDYTFRQGKFPDYKATRERMPEELHSQIEHIRALLTAMGVSLVTHDGYEADDVIGTLATRAAAEGMKVFIRTGDRDLFQVATDQITIVYGSSGRYSSGDREYDLKEVKTRFGVDSEQYIQMKALQGDSSDNIPGVPKIGEKTAVKLLQQFGSIEGIYGHLEEVKGPKLRDNLRNFKEQLHLNLELVRIVCDMDFPFDWVQAVPFEPNHSMVAKHLGELGLNSTLSVFHELLEEQGQNVPASILEDETGAESLSVRVDGYRTIQTSEALMDLVEELEQCEVLAFDFETTSTDPIHTKLVGMSVSWGSGTGAYLPVGHQFGSQLRWELVLKSLSTVMSNPQVEKVAHNAKFDLLVARRYGLVLEGALHDTMIMAWVLDPGRRQLGLKSLALSELGVTMQPIKDLIGTGSKQLTMRQVSIDSAAPYASDDAAQTFELFRKFELELKDAKLWDLYFNLELPLIPILADIETKGLSIDEVYLRELQEEFEGRLTDLANHMYDVVGKEFSLRSTYQLSDALFGEGGLNLPTKGLKKLKKGSYSTAAGVLENLSARITGLDLRQEEALQTILKFRQLDKLKNTYVDSLLELSDSETHKVHTSFNQAGAATGRMSSNNPNLQNIPIRTEEGRRLRKAFVAASGNFLIAADYSQIELRVLAHLAEEPGLIRAFEEDQDIHAITASELFGIPLEEVDVAKRGLAKTINFATIYGVTKFGLSSRTEMNLEEAEEFLNRYFQTYPKVEQFIKAVVSQVTEQGYVETITGRRRYFHELQNDKLPSMQRAGLERAAINAPVQGSAADILKMAMRDLNMAMALKDSKMQGWMVVQVHDELILETPASELMQLALLTRQCMEGAFRLKVPLKVDVEYGTNWQELAPVRFANS